MTNGSPPLSRVQLFDAPTREPVEAVRRQAFRRSGADQPGNCGRGAALGGPEAQPLLMRVAEKRLRRRGPVRERRAAIDVGLLAVNGGGEFLVSPLEQPSLAAVVAQTWGTNGLGAGTVRSTGGRGRRKLAP